MRSLKRILSIYMAIALLLTSFPEIPGLFSINAHAAGTLVVGASISGSSVTLTWTDVDNATAYQVLYRDPAGQLQSFKVNDNAALGYVETTVNNLSKDFIYQFKVRAGHDANSDNVIDSDLVAPYTKAVLLGVSFNADSLGDTSEALPGGGKEIGANPAMRFKIKQPMKWSNEQVDGGGSVGIFTGDGTLPIPDYDITLGTDNDGQNRTKIKVRYNSQVAVDDKYIVTRVSGSTVKTISETVSSSVYGIEPGWIVFDCLGGDDAVPYIDRDDTGNDIYDSANKTGFKSYNIADFSGVTSYDLADIYKNPDITPGTVLKMSVKPVFPSNTVVSLGSSVAGGYAYTPVHFQITKSKSNDLLVTVFRVNQSGADETANFTYEVLYSSDEDVLNNDLNIIRKTQYPNGITIGASQSDEFAQGSDRITLFVESKDPNSIFYYRIVAKAPVANQWLLSEVMDFKIADVEASAPLPEEVRVLEVTPTTLNVENTFFDDGTLGDTFNNIRTAEVKLIWKNPRISSDDLYYHILLAPEQDAPMEGQTSELETISKILDDPNKSAKYEIRYRKVLKVHVDNCVETDENGVPVANGNYLSYTIRMSQNNGGHQLFKLIDENGQAADDADVTNTQYQNDEQYYPTYLLTNRVYYLKMYTKKDIEGSDPSDMSIPISFTTPLDAKKNPPSPMNFTSTANEILTQPDGSRKNSITLQWSKVNINLANYTTNPAATFEQYYDLYMSDSLGGEFIRIGSAQKGQSQGIGDVESDGQQRADTDIITAKISSFTINQNAIDRFGDSLKPNVPYYFKVITRIDISDEAEDRVSEDSKIVVVTTLKGDVVPPDDGESGPKLPEGFSVDPEGESSSNSVRLVWNEMEKSTADYTIRYSLLQTIRKLDSAEDDLSVIEDVHETNNGYYDLIEHLKSDVIVPPALQHPTKTAFSYNNGKYYFNVTDLQPNTIYYFSLRAEKVVADPDTGLPVTLSSIWITLPVTTTLIETPETLQVVTANEISIDWNANTAFNPSDFTISISENGGSFKTVPNSQLTKSEEIVGGNSKFYTRITALKPDTTYDVQVTGSTVVGGTTINYNNTFYDLDTREPKHQIDVKWKGREGYDFEIAIKGEDEIGSVQPGSGSTSVKLSNLANTASDYYNNLVIEITSGKGAGQQRTITDYNGSTRVATLDKAWNVIPDNTSQYKIFKEYVTLTENNGGTVDSNEFVLISKEKPTDLVNTSFYMYYARIPLLKANTKYYIKVRSVSGSERSRYTEPVSTRTDFSQDDYDDEEQDNQENANYFDQVKKFRNSLYWIMGTSSSTFKAKIRRDMAESYIKSNSQPAFVLELLEGESKDRSMSAVYIPKAVMQLLSERDTSLVIKVPGAEYNIRPNSIDYSNSEEIEEVSEDRDVKEVYLYIEIENLSKSGNSGPSGSKAVSDIHKMNVQAVGMEYSDADIEQAIKVKIDKYISDGLEDLKDKSSSSKDTPEELKEVIEDIVEDVEEEYRDFIEDYIEGGGGYSSIIEDTEDLLEFDVPFNVKMSVDSTVKGVKTGYSYSGGSWMKVPSTSSSVGSTVSFNFAKPGKLAVFCVDITTQYNIPFTHWAKNDITSFASKYDISDIFNQYTGFDNNISVYNTVLLVERVVTGTKSEGNMSLQDRAKKIGMDGLINYGASGRNISRQELAALTVKIYEIKTGIKASDLKLKKTILIKDAADIKDSYYKSAEICVDLNFITLDSGRNFRPKEASSGAQVITVLTRLLKVLGEL